MPSELNIDDFIAMIEKDTEVTTHGVKQLVSIVKDLQKKLTVQKNHYEDAGDAGLSKIHDLQAENERLKAKDKKQVKALKFYADPANWKRTEEVLNGPRMSPISIYMGEVATEALKKKPSIEKDADRVASVSGQDVCAGCKTPEPDCYSAENCEDKT